MIKNFYFLHFNLCKFSRKILTKFFYGSEFFKFLTPHYVTILYSCQCETLQESYKQVDVCSYVQLENPSLESTKNYV